MRINEQISISKSFLFMFISEQMQIIIAHKGDPVQVLQTIVNNT